MDGSTPSLNEVLRTRKGLKTILSDTSGQIFCIPAFACTTEFDWEECLSSLDLQQENIHIFGKTVHQPRLSAFYGDTGVSYVYSKREFVGLPWTSALVVLKTAIELETGLHFNSALVNYYRDGKDSMGLHADNEPELGQNPVIASMNFGVARKMVFRRNGTAEKLEIDLNHGDLLIMSGALQHNWKHEIPKQRKIIGARLNITFRKITQN